MSTGFLLHGSGSGTVAWELAFRAHVLHGGNVATHTEVSNTAAGNEVFTRTVGNRHLTTTLTAPKPTQLTEALGPLTILFDVDREPYVTLRQKSVRLFDIPLPRPILSVRVEVQSTPSRTETVHTEDVDTCVHITLFSTLHLRYAAALTVRPSQ